MLALINKYKRMHRTDWGCFIIAAAFFLLASGVITLMLLAGD